MIKELNKPILLYFYVYPRTMFNENILNLKFEFELYFNIAKNLALNFSSIFGTPLYLYTTPTL